ncbi:MAG: N-acetyltransferase family protein [Rhizomicrobium sp.]
MFVRESAVAAGAITVRPAQIEDMASVQAIYAHYVLTGLATFEEAPPSVGEMLSRRAKTVAAGFPYLVAMRQGAVVGYCYASSYRPRPAYRFSVEDSVYVDKNYVGKKIGTALLKALLDRCMAGPWHQMLAVIGNSGNAGSIALHHRLGFKPVGTITAVGFKLGQWVDTVMMQRALKPGRAA